jgi:hypothetical protein
MNIIKDIIGAVSIFAAFYAALMIGHAYGF